mmetsp:Transcript_10248/g.11326  ORF Transcript_10248/g.11326 Transcript_10248/m.11326 type:complete len:232 (+) Transcript_10248:77-772(+)
MLKLKKLQQAKQAAEANKANDASKPADVEKKGEGEFKITRQSSKELQEVRKKKSKENVFSLRKNRKGRGKRSRQNAAELRTQKDISELDVDATPGVKTEFPDPNNLMNFKVSIKPTEGLYKNATFTFSLSVPNSYPYDPPKAVCDTLIYHPNIDLKGAVCLNILRADWKPVLTLGSVIFGLMTLFLEPNPDDPLNKEAADLMVNNMAEFERNVNKSLRGGHVAGRQFPKLL